MPQIAVENPLWYTVPMKISIVVPCYNEADSLPHFKACFDKVAAQMPSIAFEVLLVNDGSKDETLSLCRKYEETDARICVLSFSRNFGKEAAIYAGLSHTTGELVAMLDADLQDPPELLIDMLRIMQETNCDCVAARRITRTGEPPIRSFFARTFYKIMHGLSEVRVEDGVRDFRLMRREVVEAILSLPEKRRFSKGLMVWVGFDVQYIPYHNIERVAGETKFSFMGLFRYAIEGVTCLTSTPMRISYGLCAFCILAALLLCFLGCFLPALLCAVTAFILLCIGAIGAYVARIFWETKHRPLYVLRKHGKSM